MTCRGVVPFCLHRLYTLRIMAMNHRRYIAWYHSTAQVIVGTWRAANSRPYRRSTSAPVVPTMQNGVPPLIHRLGRSPFPEGEGFGRGSIHLHGL